MPDDGLLVDYVPQVAVTDRAAAQAARGQPDAAVLARRRLPDPRPHRTSRTRDRSHAALQCGEPARPTADLPVPQGHPAWPSRSPTSSSSRTSTPSPSPPPSYQAVGRHDRPGRLRHLAVVRRHVLRIPRSPAGSPTGGAARSALTITTLLFGVFSFASVFSWDIVSLGVLPGPHLGGAVRDDRGGGHLRQRDLPGRRPRQVPGLRHRHRHLRHAGHQPHRQRGRSAHRLVVAAGLPVGLLGMSLPASSPGT